MSQPLWDNTALAQRIAALPADKRAAFEKLLRAQGVDPDDLPIVPQKRESLAFPLSYPQQRMWFLEQLNPGKLSFSNAFSFHLHGRLEIEALQRSLQEIQRRHEILRTSFTTHGDQPVQVVFPEVRCTLPVIDLSTLPPEARKAEAEQRIKTESARPFDLREGPLFRAALLRLHDLEHLFFFNIHHLVYDGWSWGVIARELKALYESFVTGRAALLPELPVQYADFANWQRQRFGTEQTTAHLSFWKDHLEGAPHVLDLPTDHALSAVEMYNGTFKDFKLSQALTAALTRFCRAEGVTLYMALLAAFQVLLQRYAGVDDIVVGSPVANRTRPELENLIGCFINPLPLRTILSGDPPFRELLRRVRAAALAAFAHQAAPFELLVRTLQPQRDVNTPPLFQALFLLQNFPLPRLELTGLNVGEAQSDRGELMYPIVLEMIEHDGELSAHLEYVTDLYDTVLANTPDHFQNLLQSIVTNPGLPVSRLRILNDAEQAKILHQWNATKKVIPTEKCLHELFEAQVAATPEAVALVAGERQLTYAELHRRAEQLARRLRALGVGPEVRVGICCERSPELIIGLLAILKAGGAYVPLDPNYPEERLRFMREDAQVAVLLTQKLFLEERGSWIEDCGLWIVPRAKGDPRSSILDLQATPDNLAYVIYTSGSTGRPKGVMIPHCAVVNYAHAATENFGLTAADRVLQFASISFDTAAEEIFPTLTTGAALVLRTEEMLGSVAAFLTQCAEWGITVLDLPTAYWHEMVEKIARAALALPQCLRLIILGGERVLPDKLASWLAQVETKARLLNTYGPTEAAIVATQCELHDASASGEVPIGYPIANARAYVLNKHEEPAPIGVKGELCLAGAGLARGYLMRPELTAEKFVPEAFGNHPGARAYRTGDRVRRLADGRLQYHGRGDEQVKIRGYRIELGEIETALNQHPAISEAVVLAKAEESGQSRLLAYCAPAHAAAVTTTELRRFLLKSLPDYMVPQSFVMLAALPKTASGKIDRRALPEPESLRPALENTFVAPRTLVEKELAAVWSSVLKVEQVGLHDNFFELGGHSLLAIQIVSRLRAAFNVEVPLRSLFEAPTVEALAALIGKIQLAGAQDEEAAKMLAELEALSEEEAAALLQA